MPGYILRSPKGGLPVVGAKNVCARGEPKSETDNYCGEDRR